MTFRPVDYRLCRVFLLRSRSPLARQPSDALLGRWQTSQEPTPTTTYQKPEANETLTTGKSASHDEITILHQRYPLRKLKLRPIRADGFTEGVLQNYVVQNRSFGRRTVNCRFGLFPRFSNRNARSEPNGQCVTDVRRTQRHTKLRIHRRIKLSKPGGRRCGGRGHVLPNPKRAN